MISQQFKEILRRFGIVILFAIGFAYVEAAVVVYLREIFYPGGFCFPLIPFDEMAGAGKLLLTEIGREAATLLIILTGSRLMGRNRSERWAAFLTIFAAWDIFYYVWLKVIIDWPGSVMDWDVLFLIPVTWASPVAAPVLVSLTMLTFAGMILYRTSSGKSIKLTRIERFALIFSAVIVVISFCIAGAKINTPDYRDYFHWPLFAIGNLSAIAVFCKGLIRS